MISTMLGSKGKQRKAQRLMDTTRPWPVATEDDLLDLDMFPIYIDSPSEEEDAFWAEERHQTGQRWAESRSRRSEAHGGLTDRRGTADEDTQRGLCTKRRTASFWGRGVMQHSSAPLHVTHPHPWPKHHRRISGFT